ncbi:MAG: NAD-dependent deacetylase [Flavobacteriales bacterium]
MQKIVIFSGAGISAESGLKTFRDSDGLWENYKIEEVATPEAWNSNPELVLNFYNMRRKQVLEAQPNDAHFSIPLLEEKFDVSLITQNIDDLHERAGSKNVLHLHGELLKSRSTETQKTYPIKGNKLNLGDLCENGYQLRPDVVWFGEFVPNMDKAAELCENADIMVVIGTSLNVYPAANLIDCTPGNCKIYLIDPKEVSIWKRKNLIHIKKKATEGLPQLIKELLEK